MLPRPFILFITISLAELCVFLMVGLRIGVPMTLAIIVITAFLGSYVAKSQGIKAYARYRAALTQGHVPHEAIIDNLLILAAGAFLIIPGFLSDSIGIALLIPPVRNFIREWIENSLRKKFRSARQTTGNPVPGNGAKKRAPQVITVDAEVVEISTTPTRSAKP